MSKKVKVSANEFSEFDSSDFQAMGLSAKQIEQLKYEGFKNNEEANKVRARIRDYWQSSEYQNKLSSKKATEKKAKDVASLGEDVKKYEVKPFEYQTDNPYLSSMRRVLNQQTSQTAQDITRGLAQRGALDSGQAMRAKARLGQQTGEQMANIIGQDYLRQYTTWGQEEGDRFNRLLQKYNVGSDAYSRAQNDYYQKLALQQQQANEAYQQRQQQGGFNWGGLATGVLGAGMTALGAGLIPVTGGLSAALVTSGAGMMGSGFTNLKSSGSNY